MTIVNQEDFDLLKENPIPGVYGLEGLFTDEWCQDIIKEAEELNKWTTQRHEAYPTHDVPITDLSEVTHTKYHSFLLNTILPYFAQMYHMKIDEGTEFTMDSFVAKYSPDKQSTLGLHHDDSYVTTLITLNDNFEGGGTFFSDFNTVLKPKKGTISIHPGELTHFHGARPTTEGTRYILVSFIKVV